MELLKFREKAKKNIFYSNLLDSLVGLQKSIDSKRSGFDLNKFFLLVGEVLEKNGVSILVTIFSDKKKFISVRYLNDVSEDKTLRKAFNYYFLDTKVRIEKDNNFTKFYLNESVQYAEEREKDIYKSYKKKTKNIAKDSLNSIICPIIIRGETIGFFEFLSPKIKKNYLDLLDNFVKRVSKSISSLMLFNELKDSEEKFKDIFENAEEGFYILNGKKKKFVEVNKALVKISGYTKDELLQMNYITIFPERERSRVDSYVKNRLLNRDSDKSPKVYETVMQSKDGVEKNIKIKIGRYINNEEWFVIVSDISNEKIAEQKLYETKKHYISVIDTIREGIFVTDNKFNIISYNKFFARKVNLPVEKIKNKKCSKILPRYENDLFLNELSREDSIRNMLTSVFKSKESKHTERKIVYKKNIFYYIVDIYPRKNKVGEVFQAVVTINDITKSREAEEEIRKLDEFKNRVLNNVPVSIAMLNKQGKIVSLNKYAQDLMGQNIVNKKLVLTSEIKKDKKLAQLYKKLLSKGESFKYENLSYQVEGMGETKYLNLIAAPLFDKEGSVEGAISMAVDDTESRIYRAKIENLNQNLEKKVEQRTLELDIANKNLNRALDLKLKFISDASHELRTPLTIMKGNLDLLFLDSKIKDENILDVYRDIEDEIGRMSNIISDLTMLTNVDSEMEKLYYEKVDLVKVLESAIKSLTVIAREKNISLKSNFLLKKIIIKGDEAKLDKIFINLVRNAIKYTDNNGWVKIYINKENKEAVIRILDNGIGIPEKDLSNIFERFYRVDKARSRAEGGTGLGLAISKWIVEAHNGKIEVKSEEGIGSEFIVRLPLNQERS